MRMLRRLLTGSMVALVAIPIFSGGARGEPQGVIVVAESSGLTVTYHDPSSGVPADPTMEIHEAYSVATIDSGPSGHGLSSVAWPGSAAANAGDFFGFPTYPVRAEAFYPSGPESDAKKPAGRMSMEATATESQTEAATESLHHEGAPPGAFARKLTSSARTTLEEDMATSTATSTAKDIEIFDGLVAIKSVTTTATATSDGVKAHVDGKTKITGVTVGGREATIDEEGIHAGERALELPDVFGEGPTEDVLERAGITIKQGRSEDSGKGASATRELGGLVVKFEAKVLKDLVEPLPDRVQEEIEKNIDFNKEVVFRFGGVLVSAAASEAFEPDLPGLPPAEQPDLPSLPPSAPPLAAGIPPQEPPLDAPRPAPEEEAEPAPAAAAAPEMPTFPLPAVLVVLTLAGAVAGAPVFRRLADTLVSGGGSCPYNRS